MPRPTFETERFTVRPLLESDLPLLIEMDTDADVMRYVGTKAESNEEVLQKLPRYLHTDKDEHYGFWCILDRATGEAHGWVLLKHMPLEDGGDAMFDEVAHDGFEIGYRLKKSSWGKGIATEASRPFLAYAFEEIGLDRVMGCTHPDHVVSQHVLQKLGLKPLGLQRAYGEDIPVFRLTVEEWKAMNKEAGA